MSQNAITHLEAAIAEHNQLMDRRSHAKGKIQFAAGGRDADEVTWFQETGQWGGLLVHRSRTFEVYSATACHEDQCDHLLIVSPLKTVTRMPLDAQGAFNVLASLEPGVNLLLSAEAEPVPPAIGILGLAVTIFADQLTGRTLLTALYKLFASRVGMTEVLLGEGEDHWTEATSTRDHS